MDLSNILRGGSKPRPPKPETKDKRPEEAPVAPAPAEKPARPEAAKPAPPAAPKPIPPAPASRPASPAPTPSPVRPEPVEEPPQKPAPSVRAPAPRPARPEPVERPRPLPAAPAFTRPGFKLHQDVPTMEDMEFARAFFLRAVSTMKSFFNRLSVDRKLENSDIESLSALAVELVKPLKASPNSFLIYVCRGTADDYLVGKHVNVGVLAGRLALQLGRTDEEAAQLIHSGWLHDFGLGAIQRLDLETRKFSPREKAQLMAQCIQTESLLLAQTKESPYLVEACLSHHERLDGAGYPKGLKGSAIPFFARVLGVAENYESISHVRPYRDRQLPHEAMKQVIDLGGTAFDESIVKALIQSLSIYPPGSYVELNNKTVARVVGINENMPTRPLLLPVFDSGGRPILEGAFLDLSATPLVRIQRAIDESALNLVDAKTLVQLRAQRWWTAG